MVIDRIDSFIAGITFFGIKSFGMDHSINELPVIMKAFQTQFHLFHFWNETKI